MDVAITELEKIDADRIDGVGMPANGIPVLLLKAVAPEEPAVKADGSHAPFTGSHSHEHPAFGGPDGDGDGDHSHDHSHDGDADHHHGHAAKAAEPDREAAKAQAREILASLPDGIAKAVGKRGTVDEAPDIDLGNQILALLGQAMAAEAQEVAAGNAGEVCDIMELACAAEAVRCWRDGEQAVSLGDVMPASMLMQSAAKAHDGNCGPDCDSPYHDGHRDGWGAGYDRAMADVTKADLSAEGRRKSAAEGNALPDGSYPIENAHDLHSAAILARSGHGDVAAAKRLIARRAQELGVANPLDDSDNDTSKSQLAQEGITVDTGAQGTDDLSEVVKATDAKAASLEKRVAEQDSAIKALEGRLAKVEATPVPGGPVLSRNVQVKQAGAVVREDWAAKAAYFREMAETVTDRPTADGYRKLAREADEKAALPAT